MAWLHSIRHELPQGCTPLLSNGLGFSNMMTLNAAVDQGAMSQVLHILAMRYQIQPREGLSLVQNWLQDNPNESAGSLQHFLQSNKILILNRSMVDLRQVPLQQLEQIAAMLRGTQGVEVKDRWYLARRYARCFVGSEAVTCLQTAYGISEAEAIRYGQLLVENDLVSHVTGQHLFENEFLFYRFQQDAV